MYNEIDPKAAAWLRQLIADGHLHKGPVNERSIKDLEPGDCPDTSHFFAGIGGWAHALALADWPTDLPVWTGSCPCQPFSKAGRGLGIDDERHLWPTWRDLIAKRRPSILFGEQVAGPAGREWFTSVRADLEALGYAVGCADLCAAGSGAPHLRQRLFFGAVRLADSDQVGHAWGQSRLRVQDKGDDLERRGGLGGLADAGRGGMERNGQQLAGAPGEVGQKARKQRVRSHAGDGGAALGLGDANMSGLQGRSDTLAHAHQWPAWAPSVASWVVCSDGVGRPFEPGAFPLSDGVPARVVRIRGYGNAIVPQVGAAFIESFMEAL